MPIGIIGPNRWDLNPQVEKHRDRFYGRYAGFVRDRNDPIKAGRCRIHVPDLLGADNKPEAWLDWCYPASAGLAVPPVGAPVWVSFEDGQVQHGVYEWGWLTGDDSAASSAPKAGKGEQDPTWHGQITATSGGFGPSIPATIPKDSAKDTPPTYPYNKVFESESGHVLELDDTPSRPRARYRHPSGTTLLVDTDGSLHIISASNVYERCKGDRVIILEEGASFKVVYDKGTSMSIGPRGYAVTGHAASILGRTVLRSEDEI